MASLREGDERVATVATLSKGLEFNLCVKGTVDDR